MRRANFLAFDEYVPAGATSLAPQFTTAELNTKLAQFDQLAIQVVIDNVTGSPIGSFDLYIEHSADGRNFVPVKSVANPPPPGSGDVSFGAGLSGGINVRWGAHDGDQPLLGHARFRMFFSNSSTAAHVRVFVTQRDQA